MSDDAILSVAGLRMGFAGGFGPTRRVLAAVDGVDFDVHAGETLKLRELEYIQAAQAFGVADLRIIVRHILPNLMHIVIIALVMDFSSLVLAEAVLSYVGIGVDPSMISFGTMINNARMELAREPMVWWSLAAAFVFMFALVLAANLLADAVRDAFDPRMVGAS